MHLTEKKLLLEIERINDLLYFHNIKEQSVGFPIIPMHTYSGFKDLYSWMKTWDKHDWLTFIDVTATVLGSIPSPASPFFLGTALAASLADAAVYWNEGDKYMSGIVLAFSVIPGGELVKYLKKTSKIGKKEALIILERVKSGKATKSEIQTAKEMVQEFGEHSEEIAKLSKINIAKNFITKVLESSLSIIVGSIVLLIHTGKAVGKTVIQLGGIYYTYDEIYLALNKKNKENLKIRYNSRFQNLIRLLKVSSNLESVEEQAEEFIKFNSTVIQDNPNLMVQIDPVEQKKTLDALSGEKEKELIQNEQTKVLVPSINEVLKGAIDPQTNKASVIKKGMRGEQIYYIQKLLDSLDYSEVLKDYKENVNYLDSIFGNNTETAVYMFQEDNNLKKDGVIDKNTLKLMISMYKNKNK